MHHVFVSKLSKHATSIVLSCGMCTGTKGHCKLSQCWCWIIEHLPLYIQSLVPVNIHVIELNEHAWPILMYGPKLFFVIFQKRRCLHKFLLYVFSVCHQTLSSYQVSSFSAFRLVNFVSSIRRRTIPEVEMILTKLTYFLMYKLINWSRYIA